MATQHQVLVFVLVDFRGDWKRSFSADAGVMYQALAPANEIAVVTEGKTGILKTYHYHLPVGAEAAVIDDVIHIPARCVKSEPDNTVKCAG